MTRPILALFALAVVGCEGAVTASQRVTGEWVGRAETAAERTVREWPGRSSDSAIEPENPEVAAAVAKAPVTDLELAGPVGLRMRLDEDGRAEMTLDGNPPVAGIWRLTTIQGSRAKLEIAATRDENDAPERRQFDLVFLPDRDGFTISPAGADRRFGRLLFTRSGAADNVAP